MTINYAYKIYMKEKLILLHIISNNYIKSCQALLCQTPKTTMTFKYLIACNCHSARARMLYPPYCIIYNIKSSVKSIAGIMPKDTAS